MSPPSTLSRDGRSTSPVWRCRTAAGCEGSAGSPSRGRTSGRHGTCSMRSVCSPGRTRRARSCGLRERGFPSPRGRLASPYRPRSSRSRRWPRPDSPTVRSPTGCSFRTARWAPTCIAFSRNSGSYPGQSSLGLWGRLQRADRAVDATSIAPLRLLREPGRGVRANPVDEGKQVIRSPLLGDFSVLHAVHVDRIPPDVLARRGDPEEVPLVCSLDDRADGHNVSFRDDVLLDVFQVRECGNDRADQPGEVLATLDCSQGAAVPLHVGRQVVRHSIGLVLVERRFDERANDPLVFLQVVLSSHLAPHCWCRFVAHAFQVRWPIDSWLLTDDYFFARSSSRMTYSQDWNDLAGRSASTRRHVAKIAGVFSKDAQRAQSARNGRFRAGRSGC